MHSRHGATTWRVAFVVAAVTFFVAPPLARSQYITGGGRQIHHVANGVASDDVATVGQLGSGGGGSSGITQLTGAVTAGPGSGSQVSTITANAVALSMFAQLPTLTIIGNNTGGTANAAALTMAQLRAILGLSCTDISSATTAGCTLLTSASAAAQRTALSLVPGTDVQALNANLTAFGGLSLVTDRLPYANGTGTLSLATYTSAARTWDALTTIAAMTAALNSGTSSLPGILQLAQASDVEVGTDTAKALTAAGSAATWIKGTDNAGGATITMGDGGSFNLITSTTAITAAAFTNDTAGRKAVWRFNTIRTLTNNSTSMILPTSANITTAVGDIAQVESLGAGNFRVDWYTKADGTALSGGGGGGVSSVGASGELASSGGTTPSISISTPVTIAHGGSGQATAVLSAIAFSPKGADIASASTVDLSAATGTFVHVTGTGTITSFGTVAAGAQFTIEYTGAATVTQNSTSLILITGANRTTAAGDIQTLVSEGAGNWRETSYHTAGAIALQKANNLSDLASASTARTNLGISTIGNTGALTDGTGTLLIAHGGTSTTTATGSGNLVLATSPSLTTPTLGAATATTINKLTFTQPATGSTLTLSDGVTLTVPSTLNTSTLAPLASPTFTGTVTLPAVTLGGAFASGGNNITNIQDVTYKFVDDGNKTGAAPAISDFTTGQDHKITLTGNVTGTPTWTWPTLSTTLFYSHLQVCQDATGSRTIASWPSSPTLVWIGGSAPTLSTTASACDYLSFRYDGTTVTGYMASAGGGGLSAPVANSSLATMAANTIKMNNTGSTATPTDVTVATALTALGALPLAGGTMSGAVAHGNNNVTGVKQLTYNSEVDNGNKTGASQAIADFTVAHFQKITLTGNVSSSTWTMASGVSGAQLKVCQDATGSRTLTWPTSPAPTWLTGSAPTLSTTASACDLITVYYDGTLAYANKSGAGAGTSTLDGISSSGTIASATTTNIGGTGNVRLTISGTTTITAFDSVTAGIHRFLTFSGALTLTPGASLILPNGMPILTTPGDTATCVSEGSGTWRCWNFTRAATNWLARPLPELPGWRAEHRGMAAGSSGDPPWSAFSIGTAAGGFLRPASTTSEAIFGCQMGTTTTGECEISTQPNFTIGGGQLELTATSISVDVVSDGTNTYQGWIGMGNWASAGNPTNGIFFRADTNTNWQCVQRASSTETTADSGIAVGTTKHQLTIVVNAAGTPVTWYVDNVAVCGAIAATNIPATSVAMRAFVAVLKSAGTTDRRLTYGATRLDYRPTN